MLPQHLTLLKKRFLSRKVGEAVLPQKKGKGFSLLRGRKKPTAFCTKRDDRCLQEGKNHRRLPKKKKERRGPPEQEKRRGRRPALAAMKRPTRNRGRLGAAATMNVEEKKEKVYTPYPGRSPQLFKRRRNTPPILGGGGEKGVRRQGGETHVVCEKRVRPDCAERKDSPPVVRKEKNSPDRADQGGGMFFR